jgi:hypothetical protein
MIEVVPPARNRVTPLGEIVAIPLRGALGGNRGILHDGREIVRRHASDLWITCALEFQGRRYEQWRPHHFTWLYFHDEAVSLAAGHRPCAYCRRERYDAYRTAWAEGLGVPVPTAKELNRLLHAERIHRGTHRRRLHEQPWSSLPDGVFCSVDGTPALVLGRRLVEWTTEGYAGFIRRPRSGTALAVTPPASIAALRAGYAVQVDGGAGSPPPAIRVVRRRLGRDYPDATR